VSDSKTDTNPYDIRLVEQRVPGREGVTVWFAEDTILPGCHAVGRDMNAALAELERSRAAWLVVAHERGISSPLPESGRRSILVIYLPKRQAAKARAADSGYESEVIDVRVPDGAYA
jgi:predicted RNase H-like HicB family nuclease